MKRAIYILVIISFIALAAGLSYKPLIFFIAKKQLSQVFIGSRVDIAGCELKPLSSLRLKGIRISRQKKYDFQVKELTAEYSLFPLLSGRVKNISLQGAEIEINFGQESLAGWVKLLNLKNQKSAFLVNGLRLSDTRLDIQSRELTLKASVSLAVDLVRQSMEYLEINVASLEGSGLELKDAFLEAKSGAAAPGLLRIAEVKYDKLAIKKIEGQARLEDKSLSLESLFAQVLGGDIRGKALLELRPAGDYRVELRAQDIDLSAFISDFNLGEKLSLSGRLNGRAALRLRGSGIDLLSGDFSAAAPGGMLTIKDTAYLESIARSSRQPLDLLVESFKNYRYNTGVVKLSFSEGNIILDIVLEGEAGRRNLSVILHDIQLGRPQ